MASQLLPAVSTFSLGRNGGVFLASSLGLVNFLCVIEKRFKLNQASGFNPLEQIVVNFGFALGGLARCLGLWRWVLFPFSE